ncbi:MAG: hypothetical protein AB1414_03405 [bacterium]
MQESAPVVGSFFFFGLFLLILAYSNKKLTHRPNQIFLMLGVIMLLIWVALFILEIGGPF